MSALKLTMVFTVLGTLNACSVSAQSSIREHKVEISDFLFYPQSIEVKQGDLITWTNRDIAPHTATGFKGSWDTGNINMGESKTIVVSSAMDLNYICKFHPNMKAVVVVKPD